MTMNRLRTAWLLAPWTAMIGAGCGPASAPPAPTPPIVAGTLGETPAAAEAPVESPAPPPASFADVPAALAALDQAIADGSGPATFAAEAWLATQGAAAVSALAERARNETLDPRGRTSALRVLGRLGAEGGDVLLEFLDSDDPILRTNAFRNVAKVKPTSPAIVERLTALLADDDPARGVAAADALREIGPPAEACAERLRAIIGDLSADDDLRAAAGKALKAIDPRRTFLDE